jgi:hypothetical protein
MHQNMHQRFPSSSNSQQISDKSFILLVPGGGGGFRHGIDNKQVIENYRR